MLGTVATVAVEMITLARIAAMSFGWIALKLALAHLAARTVVMAARIQFASQPSSISS